MNYERDYTFRRGDVCYYNDPCECDESSNIMHGKRPVVVVSANRLNETSSLVTVVPMTTNTLKKIYPTQIEIIMNVTRSRIKCDQIRVVNKTDLEPPIAGLKLAALGALDSALMYALGVDIDNAGCARLAAVCEEV